jgi:hypothetical protein
MAPGVGSIGLRGAGRESSELACSSLDSSDDPDDELDDELGGSLFAFFPALRAGRFLEAFGFVTTLVLLDDLGCGFCNKICNVRQKTARQ